MKLGSVVILDKNVEEKFVELKNMGLPTCQVVCWNPEFYTDEFAMLINNAKKKVGIEISALWAGWSGPVVWDFYQGQNTLGLVPEMYAFIRVNELLAAGKFAKKIEVEDVITHCGYIPENPLDEKYSKLIQNVRYIAEEFKKDGLFFLFETGQETPVTLRRTIEDIGTNNLGINLDPANLLMYGKANPVDAVKVFGEYVRNVHAKDGEYPTNGKDLGEEKALGEGSVNFPAFIEALKIKGYDRYITIEREISGQKQLDDIKKAIDLLNSLI